MKVAVRQRLTASHARFDLATAAAATALNRCAALGGPVTPPVPVDRIASALGYQVVLLFDIPEEISGLVSTRERLIGVNGRHHPHRRRFTVGHELGHVLLGHPPESLCSPDRTRIYNIEADRCASDILIPVHLLIPLCTEGMSLTELSRLFDVSAEAMALKLRHVGNVPGGR